MKDISARVRECARIVEQLRELRLYEETADRLVPVLNEFVRRGQSASGAFRVVSVDRRLEYQFSNVADSFVVLRGGE